MKSRLAFGVLWLASAQLITQDEEALRAKILLQRAVEHFGSATADVSADGRFVAFESAAPLVPADQNRSVDIYVLERSTGHVTLESVVTSATVGDGTSHPRLSGDGRYLVFTSSAHNLADQPMATVVPQVLLRDRRAGTTTLVSRTLAGAPANEVSGHADVSDDGGTVVFQSAATDLVDAEDRNGPRSDVYAFDVRTHRIERVSVDANGVQQAAGSSFAPTVSGDGRSVVFVSSVLLDGVFNRRRSRREAEGVNHVYLRNLNSGFIRRISQAPAADEADGPSFHPAVSGDGRLVAFASRATNLVPRDRNRVADVYLHDVHTGQTTLVSRSARGGSATGSSHHPALSADGRLVAFVSDAADLACASRCPNRLLDLNLVADVYVFDTLTHALARVSGARARSPWWEVSTGPSLDGAGRVIAFSSRHPIDPSDVNHDFDLFVEEMPLVLGKCRPGNPGTGFRLLMAGTRDVEANPRC
jgi:Tol biopolymer transport system component